MSNLYEHNCIIHWIIIIVYRVSFIDPCIQNTVHCNVDGNSSYFENNLEVIKCIRYIGGYNLFVDYFSIYPIETLTFQATENKDSTPLMFSDPQLPTNSRDIASTFRPTSVAFQVL